MADLSYLVNQPPGTVVEDAGIYVCCACADSSEEGGNLTQKHFDKGQKFDVCPRHKGTTRWTLKAMKEIQKLLMYGMDEGGHIAMLGGSQPKKWWQFWK